MSTQTKRKTTAKKTQSPATADRLKPLRGIQRCPVWQLSRGTWYRPVSIPFNKAVQRRNFCKILSVSPSTGAHHEVTVRDMDGKQHKVPSDLYVRPYVLQGA